MTFVFSSSMAKGGASESAFSWVSQGKNELKKKTPVWGPLPVMLTPAQPIVT